MIRQYPYQLWVETMPEAAKGSEGDYQAPTKTLVQLSACRDEANSAGRVISLKDGIAYQFDSLIQLPRSCPDVAVGSQIKVFDGDLLRLEGRVRAFRKDQLHCRLWV